MPAPAALTARTICYAGGKLDGAGRAAKQEEAQNATDRRVSTAAGEPPLCGESNYGLAGNDLDGAV